MIPWLGLACTPEAPPHPAPPALVARFQCDRCHDATPVFASAPEERSCVDCHRAILRGDHDRRFLSSDLDRWKQHLHRLVETPSLVALDRRVTREWFVDWVQDPSDLRPHLPADMPRLPVGTEDADALAELLGLRSAPDEPTPTGDVSRGLALVTERCLPCHDATPLAPELARIRERSWPSAVDRWLVDPASVKPDATMPPPGLDAMARADVVAALFSGALTPAPRPPIPPKAPLPDRRVTWAEVDGAVFHEVCRHCHADPAPVGGDGGPGNTGGFGYAGAGLDLSSEAALRRGGRHDVLAPLDDGTPRLVAHLWARHVEVAGGEVPGILGMPLGLPPLPPERIALVEAWISQGEP